MHQPIFSRLCQCLLAATISLTQSHFLLADDKPAAKQSKPRAPAEISRDETSLVRLAFKKVDEAKRVKAIVDLCELFVEVGEHPEVDKSATLQRVSVEVQNRLRGIEERLAIELRHRNIPEPQSMIEIDRAKRKSRATSWRTLPASEPTLSASEPTLAAFEPTLAASATTKGLGGPGGMNDIGWWLVDLIRHTIQPDYWDTAGGPGTVVYYGPSRALVIRGSWRIHEELGDLLSALR